MKLSDFDFDLPQERIALRPMSPRGDAKLLVSQAGQIEDAFVRDLCCYFRPGDRLVLNDTKVIPARLSGTRARQSAQGWVEAKIEVTLMEPQASGRWKALDKASAQIGSRGRDLVSPPACRRAALRKPTEKLCSISLPKAQSWMRHWMPAVRCPCLPISRPNARQMRTTRAIIKPFGRNIAALWRRRQPLCISMQRPWRLLQDLGVAISYVTLHVGAGTFLPVKVEEVSRHKMHAEWGHVSPQAVAEIEQTRAAGGRIIPVGTTALRLIETAARGGTLRPFEGNTDIFIYPGFEFQITNGLMTNFHLPKSTLLMLVAALVGKPHLDAIYAHAVAKNYRFFSYGDASLLFAS